jgi:hypothetical protein
MDSYLEKGMEVVSTMVEMATGETIGVIGWSGIFHHTPRHQVLLLKKDDTHVATPSPANTTEEAWNLSDVIVFLQVLMYLAKSAGSRDKLSASTFAFPGRYFISKLKSASSPIHLIPVVFSFAVVSI